MTTMRDVARRAAVSTATVSRALGADTRVRPETIRRVTDAAHALGYVPNSVARSLRQQRSATWALIIADIENPFLTRLTRGVEDIAQEAGYSLLLCNTDEEQEKENRYLAVAAESRVSGVLLTPTSSDADVGGLVSSGLPAVAIDRPLRRPVDTVLIDSRRAATEATHHLVRRGSRRIGCITGPRRVFTAKERVLGYGEALDDAGIPNDGSLVRYANYNIDGGREAARNLLAEHDVDALLVANSMMTVGVLEVLGERTLRPGTDIDIVAFDDAPWTRLIAPTISVIHQPAYDVGSAAGRLLLERLAEPNRPPRTIMLNATLTDPDTAETRS